MNGTDPTLAASAAEIGRRLENLRARIDRACGRVGRDPAGVTLVAVTKTQPLATVAAAALAGLTVFGENYVQEARPKIEGLSAPASWHFIGRLQSNKAGLAVRLFNVIHSVDGAKLARDLSRRAEAAGKRLPVLIQVNLSGEVSKAGVAPDQALDLVAEARTLPCLEVRGLMTLPPFFEAPEAARPYFAALRRLKERLRPEPPDLSMGMSGDFEAAVEEGATLIRIGTALFGPRT